MQKNSWENEISQCFVLDYKEEKMTVDNSNILLRKALELTPLAAQTFSKSYRYFCEGISPSFIERGEGCYLWDVDGNKYLDFVCALGPITVGYNDPRVNRAIIRQLEKGIVFSQPALVSMELAEKITEVVPCAEMVRFVKNGSDATSAAVRLARAYTGREVVLASGYHGMQDWYIGATANNKGVPKAVCSLTKMFTYNDLAHLEDLFEQYSGEVACVILEPIQGDGPLEGYLENLKRLTEKQGAILIFDEVVSGFRYALGGASELYNVKPDLAAFGKGMANGMPISAVAGRRELLKQIESGVFISTTFGGEALSMAAALETIKILQEPGVYDHFWNLGRRMLSGLRNIIQSYNLDNVILTNGLAPHSGVLFNGKGALDYLDINSLFQQEMIDSGILTVGVNNFNLAHQEVDVDYYLEAAEKACSLINKALNNNSTKGLLRGGKVGPIFKRNIR